MKRIIIIMAVIISASLKSTACELSNPETGASMEIRTGMVYVSDGHGQVSIGTVKRAALFLKSMNRILSGEAYPILKIYEGPEGKYIIIKSNGNEVKIYKSDMELFIGRLEEPTI